MSAVVTALFCSVVHASIHPVEGRLRQTFPTLALDSTAVFEAVPAGLRARVGDDATLEVVYPRTYDEAIVVTMGAQLVVLRALGAQPVAASESDNKLIYERAYRSTDVIQIPASGRSEELLLLNDRKAPLVYDYEIERTEGVSRIVLDGGAIRFVPIVKEPSTRRFTPLPRSLQIERPWVIDATGRRAVALWTLIGEKKIRLAVNNRNLTYPLVVDPSFSAVGAMGAARRYHTATLLQNGKVLMTGGSFAGPLNSAELYDPATGTFSSVGNMAIARVNHTATLLQNGRVLIIAGQSSPPVGAIVTSAELFDPATNMFTSAGNLTTARTGHTATVLQNGKVLVVGGFNTTQVGSSELYDPGTNSFGPAGGLTTPRNNHTATLLPDGRVLVVGGSGSAAQSLDSFEVYDSAGAAVTSSGTITPGRHSHSATLLSDGLVLVAGGSVSGPAPTNSAQLFNPGTGAFTPTDSLKVARYGHTATALPDGTVLLVGGVSTATVTTAERYQVSNKTFAAAITGPTNYTHTATLLSSGDVLIAGGFAGGAPTASASFYNLELETSFPLPSVLITPRTFHTATMLPNGRVLHAGGSSTINTAELFNSAPFTTTATGSTSVPRTSHTGTLLRNGRVLIAGGADANALSSAELYDPLSGTFVATGTMNAPHDTHTATLLPNGKVLIAGGSGAGGFGSSIAELYDAGGTFTLTGSMGTSRAAHSATLLPDGRVLIAGGFHGGAETSSAELYDPANGTFTATGSLLAARWHASATLLPNGKVLIAGGRSLGFYLSSAEIYDPATGLFTSAGTMTRARFPPTATLLVTGKVLIAGGAGSNAPAEIYDPATGAFQVTDTSDNRPGGRATLLPNQVVLITGGTTVGDFFVRNIDPTAPEITSAPSVVRLPAAITISGTGFRAATGSNGATNSSPTDYPLLQMERLDNEQVFFLTSATWSETSFTSPTLSALPTGYYRASIFVNGIPSLDRYILITDVAAPTITSLSPTSGSSAGGQSVTITGTNLTGAAVTIGAVSATVTARNATAVTFTTPAHTPALVDVVVATEGGSATAIAAYRYIGAPTGLTANAVNTTTVGVSWSAVTSATTYEIVRSANGTTFEVVGTTPGTSLSDSSAAAGTAYIYKVRARDGSGNSGPYSEIDIATTIIFTDDPLTVGMLIKAVHITQLRTAVNAVRVLGGLGAANFTDPTITPGVSIVRRLHITELRSALDAPRAALGLPTLAYADAIIAGETRVRTLHLTQLRNGAK